MLLSLGMILFSIICILFLPVSLFHIQTLTCTSCLPSLTQTHTLPLLLSLLVLTSSFTSSAYRVNSPLPSLPHTQPKYQPTYPNAYINALSNSLFHWR